MRFFDDVVSDVDDFAVDSFDIQLLDLYERVYNLECRLERIETFLKNKIFETFIHEGDKKNKILSVLQEEIFR
jgi:hypothetical protein